LDRNEEPFSLSHERFISATQTILHTLHATIDNTPHSPWLQRFDRGFHTLFTSFLAAAKKHKKHGAGAVLLVPFCGLICLLFSL